ncbi:EAL domain-containing protein [Lacrimispora sp. NSJ-141]|uniref:EAL domain-containing protein n=1 Tax=Lientehia hominis TaxID=2897778 RepID=A0AAP2W8Q8_9FIRM|nr:EAL domain-containing protein [Lientehia hominis]MCD2492341.1 EAL domain-containing protein [Lientehia hominis]
MYTRLMKLIYKIENNRIFSSIKKGFILLIPVLLVGSFALLFKNFPVPAFQRFLEAGIGAVLLEILNFLFDSTVGFMSVYLVMSISYYYSETMEIRSRFLQVMSMLVSMICFVASFGGGSGSMELSDMGPVGVFTAMFTAIAATKLFYVLNSRISERRRFYAPGSDTDYRNSLSVLYPLLLCVLIFIVGRFLVQYITGADNLNDLISDSIVALFENMDGGFGVGALYVLVLNILWVFGIHGGNAMEYVAQSYLVPNDTVPGVIVSKSFLDNFVMIGGCGAAICLLLALLFFAREKDNRQLARSAAPAVLFNINEILVYGLPIVLNPIMVLPFILTPLCAYLIAYGATVLGFLPVVEATVTWTTPVLFSGYLATGTVHGAILQLITVAAGTLIYAPFVRLSEKMRKSQAKTLLQELTEHMKKQQEEGKALDVLDRHDSLGMLARNMASKLRIDVEAQGLPLGYQPQFHSEKGIIGAEALLRWCYAGESVYPPLAVELAREDGFFDRLTQCVMRTSMDACRTLLREGHMLEISMNITAEQLNNSRFVDKVIRLADEYGVSGFFCLEVTEETSVENLKSISEHIERLKENGIMVLVDDFSMGSTSLKYLQGNGFYAVKLDGGLVRQAAENERSRDIVASIITLGKTLDYTVIAEYVETEDIRDKLKALGCHIYQGYLYSPAVPFEKFKEML